MEDFTKFLRSLPQVMTTKGEIKFYINGTSVAIDDVDALEKEFAKFNQRIEKIDTSLRKPKYEYKHKKVPVWRRNKDTGEIKRFEITSGTLEALAETDPKEKLFKDRPMDELIPLCEKIGKNKFQQIVDELEDNNFYEDTISPYKPRGHPVYDTFMHHKLSLNSDFVSKRQFFAETSKGYNPEVYTKMSKCREVALDVLQDLYDANEDNLYNKRKIKNI